ncbi:MAG: hypothetical protein GX418_00070 [Clostridiales bacterium]|nr:hypothetical protein [Clostridiales bacterium]
MEMKELARPTARQRADVIALLTDSFWRTPLFQSYLFAGRKALARSFLAALLRYGMRAGRVFVMEDSGKPVACALWSGPDSPEMSLQTYLTTGMWPQMLSIALRSPAAMRRVAELFRFLEGYVPGFPCHTLEFLASTQKGAGAALVRACLPRFRDLPLYVESIVSKNDHAFYRQFGFKPFAKAEFHGTDYAFALLDEAEAAQAAEEPAPAEAGAADAPQPAQTASPMSQADALRP